MIFQTFIGIRGYLRPASTRETQAHADPRTFCSHITRDIPPVVYFHEQSPAKLQAEVSEYIITGGYPEGDPRAKRYGASGGTGGIHDQFVHLLQNILLEFKKKGGPELPASWISGFYGSGKSSFAKLLGLALDGVVLPDGTPLEKALLARDDSPKRDDLLTAWQKLRAKFEPIAVVFDIGGVARDNEHIHSAILRQVQRRLGYCSKSNLIADHELKLQKDGDWDRFQHDSCLGRFLPVCSAWRREPGAGHHASLGEAAHAQSALLLRENGL